MLKAVSAGVRERLNRAASVLEQTAWQCAELAQAVVVTVCQDVAYGQTVVRVCGRDMAEMNIVLPGLLKPMEVARAIIGALAPSLRKCLGSRRPVVIFDGDCEDLNMKEVFEGVQVIRSLGQDVPSSAAAIRDFVGHPAPTAANAVIVGGLPATLEESARVFRSATEASDVWETWADVAPRWERAVRDTSFTQAHATGASKADVLKALVEKSHVIMIVAHAETEEIFLPQPPPTGSSVTGQDLRLIKDQISANGPLVYLFCCETAAIDKLESMSRVLLECGVAGVVAPRLKLSERRARELMLALARPREPAASALDALTEAEAQSGCTDMETFVR